MEVETKTQPLTLTTRIYSELASGILSSAFMIVEQPKIVRNDQYICVNRSRLNVERTTRTQQNEKWKDKGKVAEEEKK